MKWQGDYHGQHYTDIGASEESLSTYDEQGIKRAPNLLDIFLAINSKGRGNDCR